MYRYCTFFLVLFLPSPLLASAWTLPKGEGQFIFNATYYTANRYYDNNGDKQNQGTFTKQEINPYITYGLTDNTTIGGNFFLEHNSSELANDSSYGIGDTEIFLRHKLWDKDGWILSVEPVIKLPSPTRNELNANIGSKNWDIGAGLSLGYGLTHDGRNHYAGLDTSYRYRTGGQADQVRIAATVGIELSEKIVLLPQLYFTYRTSAPEDAAFTQSPDDDYNLIKGQLSAVYRFSDEYAVQLGAFHDIAGRNTGAGYGGLFSIWRSF